MTQKYSDGVGALDFASGGTTTQSKTYPTIEAVKNRLSERIKEYTFDEIAASSSDAVLSFDAPDDGKIIAVTLENGSVAADGTNGLELSFINVTNSNDVVAYVGFGSGTEAVKATDTDASVLANVVSTVKVTDVSTCNLGDKIQCTIDRDGTTIVGRIKVHYEVSAVGR